MFKKIALSLKKAFLGAEMTPEQIADSKKKFDRAMNDLAEKSYWGKLDNLNSVLQLEKSPMQTLDESIELGCGSKVLAKKDKYVDAIFEGLFSAPKNEKADFIKSKLPGIYDYTEDQYQKYLGRYCEAFKQPPAYVDRQMRELADSDDPSKKCKLLIDITVTAYIQAKASKQPGYMPEGPTTLQ